MTRLRRSREAGALVVRGMVSPEFYAKGRLARMRYSSVLSTCFILARWRLRLRFLLPARWRRPDWDVRILPVAVILKRLATAFLVLRRAMGLGMAIGSCRSKQAPAQCEPFPLSGEESLGSSSWACSTSWENLRTLFRAG